METKHTELPWQSDQVRGGYNLGIVRNGEWVRIGRVGGELTGNKLTQADDNANAEFIVKACNSHDDLVFMANNTVTLTTFLLTSLARCTLGDKTRKAVQALQEQALAAIAKAKGD